MEASQWKVLQHLSNQWIRILAIGIDPISIANEKLPWVCPSIDMADYYPSLKKRLYVPVFFYNHPVLPGDGY